jgi:hypothetical protein
MWRAFGNSRARVAIVLNIDLSVGANTTLGAELSPVGYFSDADLARELDAVVSNIHTHRDFLRSVDRAWLLNLLVSMLTNAAVCFET